MRGRVARANHLKISLLQRLQCIYVNEADCQIIAKLFYSNRCHPDILKLVSKLFYHDSLKWDEKKSPAHHPEHEYSLVFICSSLKEDNFSYSHKESRERERNVIVDKVIELCKLLPDSWNNKNPMKNFLITSPCKDQVSVVFAFSIPYRILEQIFSQLFSQSS